MAKHKLVSPYPLVQVLWDDAGNLSHGWQKEEMEEPVPQLVMSVGFLIKETDTHTIIAMDVDEDGLHNTRGQIPKGMIKEMKILRKAPKE